MVRLVLRAQAVGAPLSSRRVWQESVGTERDGETDHTPRDWSKALKSEAQERGELENASWGGKGLHRREGSQTLRVGLSKSTARLFER